MILENLKILFKFFYRPNLAASDAIDKGSWLFAAVCVVIVSFVFQFGVNSRIVQTYAVSRMDYYMSNPGFERDVPRGGRLTPEELAEAEYLANLDIEDEMRRERRPLLVFGKSARWLFTFDSANVLLVLLTLIAFYAPTVILLVTFFEPVGSFSALWRRDYGVFTTAAFFAWAAAHLPFALIGLVLKDNRAVDGGVFLGFWAASGLLFGLLMIFVIRTVFGARYLSAVVIVGTAWLAISLGAGVFGFVSPYLFSPFLLVFAWLLLRGEVGDFGQAIRRQQNFKRYLHSATVNPRDADAHVQLGLIYKQRRRTQEALKHFQKAVEIDPAEIDANYELGRLARERGDFQAAINRFSIVVEQNEKYASSEIWREIGATYLAAGMLGEAREALEKFVARRSFDPEGLYYLGLVLKAQGEAEAAREAFQSCAEAAQTSPDFRRREAKQWGKLAQKEI